VIRDSSPNGGGAWLSDCFPVSGVGFIARWLGPFGEKSEAEISAHLIFPARPYLIARRVMKVI